MRLLSDMIDQFSTTVRVIAGLLTLGVLGFGAMMTFGAGWAAPQVAEKFAERAEKVSTKAIEARMEAERARALAKEGWGYDAGTAPDYGPAASPAGRAEPHADEIGGWGEAD